MFEFLNYQPLLPITGIRVLHILLLAAVIRLWLVDKKFFSIKRTPKTLSPTNTAADQRFIGASIIRSAAARLFRVKRDE